MRSVDVALAVARLAVGAWLLWRLPALPVPAPRPFAGGGRPASRAAGPVAVVVPARDEAASLPHLLASLQGQLGAGDELVVVDDHSTDGTAAVARAGGARVVEPPPLPAGWSGKAWACHTGVHATSAPIVALLDADVELAPGALDQLAAAAAEVGGLVSVQPSHRVRRPYEHLSGLCNVVAVMGTGCATPRGERVATRGAFGPVLATPRADLAASGGHADPTVRGAVLDDLALASAYRRAGRPVTLAVGRVASYRMYPAGLAQLVEGWSKNVAAGAGAIRPVVLLGVVAWVTVLVQGALAPLLAGWPWGIALYAAVATQLLWMLRRLGSFHPLAAVLFPVLVLAFLVVFARSLVLTLVRRRVRWRGRDLPV